MIVVMVAVICIKPTTIIDHHHNHTRSVYFSNSSYGVNTTFRDLIMSVVVYIRLHYFIKIRVMRYYIGLWKLILQKICIQDLWSSFVVCTYVPVYLSTYICVHRCLPACPNGYTLGHLCLSSRAGSWSPGRRAAGRCVRAGNGGGRRTHRAAFVVW